MMDLNSISNSELLVRMEKLARSERKITHLILLHLVEVESRRLFLDLGYVSLYKYLTAHLHYSEDAAYRRIQAARLLKKVPAIEKAIESGDLNLTQLNQVQKCLVKSGASTSDGFVAKAEAVMAQIENKSNYETQKILAVEFDLPIQDFEVVKPQKDNSVRMEVTFSEEQMKSLNHAKELLSHVLPNPTWSDLISYLAEGQIQKRLGKGCSNAKSQAKAKSTEGEREVVQAERNEEIQLSSDATSSLILMEGISGIPKKRKYMSFSVRRRLLEKANNQCEFKHSDGQRCVSKYQLQFDHKLPLALGGTNEESNLRVLCRTHNLFEARRMKISKY